MPAAEPLIIPTDAGPTLRCGDLDFYPGPDPLEYARRKARVPSLLPDSLLYVPSVGLGYGLAELLDRLPPRCAVLCVEADQGVMRAAMDSPLPSDPRLLVVRAADEEAVREALRRLGGPGVGGPGPGAPRFRRVVEAPLCAGYRLDPARYAQFRRVLEEEIRRGWQNRLTLISLGSLQGRNLVANLGRLPAARDFSALSSGFPAVVAGAGPSLDQSVPLLCRWRPRILLVAADTALPALAARGLSPDLVVALEAQWANVRDFFPCGGGGIAPAALACDLTSHPAVPRIFAGRTFFFSSRYADLSVFERLGAAGLLPSPFPALGSVGVAAVRAALHVTSGPVFVTGLDFSVPGLTTHARGTPQHLAMLIGAARLRPVGQDTWAALCARRLVRVAGKGGEEVATDHVLQSYRDTLRRLLAPQAGRVRDIGARGIDLGVPRAGDGEFADIVAGAAPAGRALEVGAASGAPRDAARGFTREAAAGFLAEEAALLRKASGVLRGGAESGVVSEECRALLAAADYAWVHFPDTPDLDARGAGGSTAVRSFLARAAAAAAWYAARAERVLSVL
jgi:hypothetical protein